MPETRLVDFSPAQLQVLVTAIELLRSEKKLGFFKLCAQDDVDVVRTQVLTAVGIVGARERAMRN